MSALGHKRTFRGAIVMSALPPKADIGRLDWNVRFGPEADIHTITRYCAVQPPSIGIAAPVMLCAHSETGVSEKTVDELRARTTWPPGLVVTTPREIHPKSVVKISKAP